jgi:hypothetical protein
MIKLSERRQLELSKYFILSYSTCHAPYDVADSLAENISGAQNAS